MSRLNSASQMRWMLFPFVAVFFISLSLFAQDQGVTASAVRISRLIDESDRITLSGNTHPLASPQYDRGPAQDSMPAPRMLLVLTRSAAQQAALDTYLNHLQDPAQVEFHKWLTPEEFGSRFGVSDADVATVKLWLESHGFSVSRVSKSRMSIEFSGTSGELRNAFHTELHRYVYGNEQHWANASDPQIPSALAPVVAGFAELGDFVPRAQFVRGPSGVYNPSSRRIEPSYTLGNATNGYTMFLGPADAATIYDIPNRYNALLKGTAFDGTGVTIGIAGDSNINLTQNVNYRATFGLPAKATEVVVDGDDPGENGDAVEAYLDTQVAGGIAPNANVILYTAANTYIESGLFLAIVRALDDNLADILNVSFGACELNQGASGNAFVNQLWQQAAAQGISVTVSSGDSGSAGCDEPDTESEAGLGLAVNGLASTPYDIAVGGTDFDVLYSNFPASFTDFADVTNTLSYHRSALGYIPEEPWNNSTAPGHNTTVSKDMPWHGLNIQAGGGGVSSCAIKGSGRCHGYPVPAWQEGIATDSSGRNLPDVSFLAGNGLYGALWGLCTDQEYNAATGKPIVDCAGTPAKGNNFNLTGVGGTSASSPLFAGILALLNQKTGGRLGQANTALYGLAKSGADVFHEIETGNNSVFCEARQSTGCAENEAGYYFMTGYNAGGRYSEATGLGSVDADALLNEWSGVGLTPTTSKLTLDGGAGALHLTHGEKASFAVNVTSHSGQPGGGVAIVDNLSAAKEPNSGSIGTLTLAGGSVKGTVDDLPGGSYRVSAHYGGSSTFAASDSNAIAVTVEPESSSTSLIVTQIDPNTKKPSSTSHYGFISVLDAQPYGNSASPSHPNGPATGTVTFMMGATRLATAPIGSDGIAEWVSTTLPAGSYPLSAVYSGDASFKPGTSAPQTLNLPRAPTAMSAPEYNIDGAPTAGMPVTLTTSLYQPDGYGAELTGTVTFWNKTEKLGTVPFIAPSRRGLRPTGSAQWTTTRLPAGNLEVSATYDGNANYAPSPHSPPVFIPVTSAMSDMKVLDFPSSVKVNRALGIHISVATDSGLPAAAGTAYVTLGPGEYTSPPTRVVNGSSVITIPANSLPLGTQLVTITYNGDKFYGYASVNYWLDVQSGGTLEPAVTVSPSPAKITSFPFNLAVTVAGKTGKPAPTGNVSLGNEDYGIWIPQTPLKDGQITFSLQSENFPNLPQNRTVTLTATYYGDSNYEPGTATVNVTVSP